MTQAARNKVCLWYDNDAEEAARFYAATFPDSRVIATHRAPGDFPSGKSGDVLLVEFEVMGIACIGAAVGTSGDHSMSPVGIVALLLLLAVALALFLPSLAVQVRRFHDQDKSGWMVLINLIPSIGGLIVLIMMCLEGTPGPNRYGPDPKAGEPR